MNELRWLVALEAGLFFSLICWETTAIWAAPTYQPGPFAVALLGAVTAGMLTCHVGPAFFASRFPVPGWALAWLAFGYLEWLWGMGLVLWALLGMPALAAVAVCFRPAWRWLLAASLAVGAGVLAWALHAQWPGIGATNPHYTSGQQTLFEYFTPGTLLAAAPAIVIAGRIGKQYPRRSTIWWSGLFGVWLPAVLAIAVASVATDAGATLYWRPSLFRGFYWALQGPKGLNEAAVFLVSGTILAPTILSVAALRDLRHAWNGSRAMLLLPLGLCGAAYLATQLAEPSYGIEFPFFSAVHRWWAWSVVGLGAAAGLRALFLPASGILEYHRRNSA